MSVKLKNNIVRIKTYKGSGTGILYPCKYSGIEKGYLAYLVFTCAHVFEEQINSLPNDGEDIKRWVDLGIYDDLGNIVEDADIKEIRYHIPQNAEDDMCDIAVLLVQIKSNIRITLETKIYQSELKNRELLYVEGFPRVMMSDEINQKIQLEGMYKELFSKNSVVGMYQIKDDYHWYNDYQDLKLMEGFSGSPVYIEKNDEVYLLGMNQSVANIDKGENPFKIVYYLKMYYILECLRQSDCIIFRTNRDGSLDMEWVLDQVQDGKEINILMLGSSGAGKSTFTKSFAYHSNRLKTTGDGQTTRSNVFYKFSLFPEKSRVFVKFLTKEDFVKKIMNQLVVRKWICFLEDIVEIDGVRMDDTGCLFLKNIYPFFRHFLKKKTTGKIDEKWKETLDKIAKQAHNIEQKISDVLVETPDTMKKSFSTYMQEIDNCYNLVFNFLWEYIPFRYWKKCFDINKWEIISESEDDPKDIFLQKIREASKENDWKAYLEKLGEKIFDKEYCSCSNSIDILFGNKFEKLCHSMMHIEGFFDLKEVSFLGFQETEEWKKLMKGNPGERRGLVDIVEKEENDEEKEEDKEKRNEVRSALSDTCKYLYGKLYECFKKYLPKEEIEVDFTEGVDVETEDLLEKCFRSTSRGSLTIFTRSIVVEDKISNEYAWIIRRLNIKQLNILDSCGLDHIKNSVDDSIKIKNIISEYRETMQNKDKVELEEQFAVLYLKKLDAGKPDELRNILPTVVKAIPKSPIYCVFTGIDFLYEMRDLCLQDLIWDETNLKKVPKSVKYLLLDNDKYKKNEREQKIKEKAETLFGGTGISDIRKRNLYLVLKNNLIPFCGNEKILQKNFDLYESNQKYVEKLLASILIDEVGSMEVISIDEKALYQNEEYISEIVRLIFEKATKKEWKDIHHMIRKADYNRLVNENEEYGYYSYVANVRLQWYQLFLDAYDEVISTEKATQDFIQEFPKGEKAAIESVLLQMGEHYLFGNPDVFNQKQTNDNQTEFRKALDLLYEKEELKKFFNKNNDELKDEEKPKAEEIIDYLKNSTNFIERYENCKNKGKFTEIFIDALKKQISDNNSVKAEGLLRINEEFEEALHNLERLFETKYDDDKLLYIVLKEYVKKKIKR